MIKGDDLLYSTAKTKSVVEVDKNTIYALDITTVVFFIQTTAAIITTVVRATLS